MTPSGELPVAEVLGDDERAPSAGRGRRLVLVGLVAVLALGGAAFAARAMLAGQDEQAAEDGGGPIDARPALPFISTTRVEVLDERRRNAAVTMQFAGLPANYRILSIDGLPPGMSYTQQRIVPPDGDVDLSFVWTRIDCTTPPGQLDFVMQLTRSAGSAESSLISLDGGPGVRIAWDQICRQVG